jgi:hypothetical protein
MEKKRMPRSGLTDTSVFLLVMEYEQGESGGVLSNGTEVTPLLLCLRINEKG